MDVHIGKAHAGEAMARSSILESERVRRRAQLRAEGEKLRADPDDVAASRDLAAEIEALRGW